MAADEAYLHAKFHLDPSNRLATIHQRYRQDRTDRQQSDSIGRTVLQTVAQKLTSLWSCSKISYVSMVWCLHAETNDDQMFNAVKYCNATFSFHQHYLLPCVAKHDLIRFRSLTCTFLEPSPDDNQLSGTDLTGGVTGVCPPP